MASPHATNERRLNAAFAALADPTRRQIVARLRSGPTRITELARPFDMSLPAVSKHVRVLEQAGILNRVKHGRTHQCSLATEPLQAIDHWLEHYRWFWRETLEALARHVESDSDGSETP